MSRIVTHCQVCNSPKLTPRFFAGYLPLPNVMRPVGVPLNEEKVYPAQLLECEECRLVQLGLEVDQSEVFPPDYSYLSGTTRALRENFADLAYECINLGFVKSDCGSLVVDIGSNDGSLLQEFRLQGCMTIGIEPTNAALKARQNGIQTFNGFFCREHVDYVKRHTNGADVVTATNVLAHCPNPNEFVSLVAEMLAPGGVFVSESHYLPSLLERVQYDTIYHEHLRYYSLQSLKFLLERHGLEIVYTAPIPTHGGSIRVYACKKGEHQINHTHVGGNLMFERDKLGDDVWGNFRDRAVVSRFRLLNVLRTICNGHNKVFAIGCPSRAVTLVNYCGLDETMIDCVCEVEGSKKIGYYVPGMMIPVVSEDRLYSENPEYALILSWHIADELIPKIRSRGFKGRFILPLPEVKVVD